MNNQQKQSLNYTPPSAADIKTRQDQEGALRLLLAQRRLYSKSKRWLGLRLTGMGAIGIAAPVIALIWPTLAVAIGAVAGVWIFLGRSVFLNLEKQMSARAAAIQELFDIEVFRMPSLSARSPMPTLEDITNLAGPDDKILVSATKEKLLEWYSIDAQDSGVTAVAICQRSNAAYSGSLLKTSAKLWLGLVGAWVAILVILSMLLGLSLGTFLLGIAFPLLPAFLDTISYWQGIRRATSEREALSKEIQEKLTNNDIRGEDLVIWQTTMYGLRREVPQVPDFVYKLMRNANETSMKSVARQLSDRMRRRQ